MKLDEYITTIPKFNEMTYWFYRDTQNHIHISDAETGEELGVGVELTNHELQIPKELETNIGNLNIDWVKFKMRPEYVVGLVPEYKTPEDMELLYDKLILGCSLIKLHRKLKSDPDEYIDRIKTKCLDWLHSTDFYICPASTQYHDSEPKGLLRHTLNVVDNAVCLMSTYPFANKVTCESIVLVSLIHDWCKIGLYTPYNRNVKNENTGKWESVQAYKYADNRAIALGHGVSSMYLAMRFFNLTIDEAAAVRWHMGRYNCVDAEINELQQANRMYPLVHLLQFADQLSITAY